MRKRLFGNHGLLFLGLVLAGTLALTGPAQAEWYTAHGQSGHVQLMSAVTDPIVYYGWGLDISQKTPSSNWVHYTVTTNAATAARGVQNVRVSFRTYSLDAWVSTIDVWDGNTKVKSFTGHWTGTRTLTFNLGSIRPFTQGVGISVQFHAGLDAMDHRVVFYSVGANVLNTP